MKEMRAAWTSLVLGVALGCRSPEAGEEDRVAERRSMVATQLKARDITDPAVLAAMETVPRPRFVSEEFRADAYDDHPVPIGHGQTISQPYIVAFMTQAIAPRPGMAVLEIGTGSGYQAAVLAEVVGRTGRVRSIEIVEDLARGAAATLRDLGYATVVVRAGDGYEGWPEEAPFDAILVTAAPPAVPTPLLRQLKEDGVLVAPIGEGVQDLVRFVRHGNAFERDVLLPVRFVPMTGKAQGR